MKPTTIVIAAGLALAGLALDAPVHAQSARIAIGAVFGSGPQYPPPAQYTQRQPPYPGRPGAGGYAGHNGDGAREYALNCGFNDGYEQGFGAARHRDRFDPRRERWYRDAERGYDRDYRMSRYEYRNVYRRGFLEGYESGYRDAQRGWYGRGGYGGPRGDRGYYPPSQGGWWR